MRAYGVGIDGLLKVHEALDLALGPNHTQDQTPVGCFDLNLTGFDLQPHDLNLVFVPEIQDLCSTLRAARTSPARDQQVFKKLVERPLEFLERVKQWIT